MHIYIADRRGAIRYSTSNNLPENAAIIRDTTQDEVATGVKTLELELISSKEVRQHAIPGNLILQGGSGGEYELFTIMEVEHSAATGTINLYAEDAGLDLLNRVVGAWKPSAAQTITSALKAVLGSDYMGWGVRINGVSTTATVGASSFDYSAEATALERLRDVLSHWNAEFYFDYSIDGFNAISRQLVIVNRRGRSIPEHTLRFGLDLADITETSSIMNMATIYKIYGVDKTGNAKALSSLTGYATYSGKTIKANDRSTFSGSRTHDYLVTGSEVRCPEMMRKWASTLDKDGAVTRVVYTQYKDAKSAIAYAMRELEKIVDTQYTYTIKFSRMPAKIGTGDYINIVDEDDRLYLKARVLEWKRSDTDQTFEATIGNFTRLQGSKAEVKNIPTYTLSITSSHGTTGRDPLTTTLTASLFYSNELVTAAEDLPENCRLQWYEDGQEIPATDPRIEADGFRLKVTNLTTTKKFVVSLVRDTQEEVTA